MARDNFFTRLFKKRSTTYDSTYPNFYYWGSETESGESVNQDRGTRISTVFTCINVICQTLASLPLAVKQEVDGSNVAIKKNPVNRLISQKPNALMNGYSFWYAIVFSYLGWGHGRAYILRDSKGIPEQLLPLAPDKCTEQVVEGELYYRVGEEWVHSRDILDFKLYTKNGYTGMSPIMQNAELMGYKLKQDKYSARVLANKPSGFLSGQATKEQAKSIGENWKAAINGDEVKGTPFLIGDVKFNPLMIPPNEGQHIETKDYTNKEIYGIFRVPPTFAQDYTHVVQNNAEQQDRNFAKHTITPNVRMIEQECNEKLFPESNKMMETPLYTHFNMNGLLRGDTETRFKAYHDMILDGVFSANDVLRLEDMPKQKGENGDKYYIQGAMIEKGAENGEGNEE